MRSVVYYTDKVLVSENLNHEDTNHEDTNHEDTKNKLFIKSLASSE